MNHFTTVTWLGIFTNICHADYKLTVKNLNLKDQYSKILESNCHNKYWVKPLRHNLKQKPKIQKKKERRRKYNHVQCNSSICYQKNVTVCLGLHRKHSWMRILEKGFLVVINTIKNSKCILWVLRMTWFGNVAPFTITPN